MGTAHHSEALASGQAPILMEPAGSVASRWFDNARL